MSFSSGNSFKRETGRPFLLSALFVVIISNNVQLINCDNNCAFKDCTALRIGFTFCIKKSEVTHLEVEDTFGNNDIIEY